MSNIRRHASWTLALALLLTQSPLDAAAAKPSAQVREITSTATGQDAAQRAAEYIHEKYGLAISPDGLAVWSVGDNVIAGPKGSTLAPRDFVAPDGTTQQYLEATEPLAVNSVEGTAVATSEVGIAATGWSLIGDHCWIQADHSYSWIDVCYHKYKATSDGSTTYDYYAVNMFSTFATPGLGLEIGDPWIQANPGSGAAHTWHKWQPLEDTDRPCSTSVTLSISVNGFPLSVGASQCATWDITKYATAGQFRNKWTEGLCMTRSGETSLEFEISSRVAQGAVPTWTFNWYMNANMASCFT